MSTPLFLILCLCAHVFAKDDPDVDCVVENLERVRCSWNHSNPSATDVRLYGRFVNDPEKECSSYQTRDFRRECIFPGDVTRARFRDFYTRLVHGSEPVRKKHTLKDRVKLNPPTNLTVKLGPDSNLWFYWNHTPKSCVQSEVRHRTRKRNWQSSLCYKEQSYSIPLPSPKRRYELQVRSRIHMDCGESVFWSEWCHPVAWGSNCTSEYCVTDKNTVTEEHKRSIPAWSVTLCVVGSATVILLALMLLQRERLRIIFVPVVPKPVLYPDMENWLQISKDLKEGFKTSYSDRACPVREFGPSIQSNLSTPCLSSDHTLP